jgi:signal transduction histidine kinase
MRTKFYTILTLASLLIILVLELTLLGGVFLVSETTTSIILASLIIAAAGLLVVFLLYFYITKSIISPLSSLANKIKEDTKIDAVALEGDPLGYIEQVSSRIKKDLDACYARISSFHELCVSLFKVVTTNDLIRAAAKGLKPLPFIEAAVVLLLNKEKQSLGLYPIFPDGITVQKEFILGERGLPLDKVKIASPLYKEGLGSSQNLNELEKIFLEKGYSSSLTVAITNDGNFLGLLGLASKEQRKSLPNEDILFIEDIASLLGLELSYMQLLNELGQKDEEVIELKHTERQKVKKQLAEIKEAYSQLIQAGKMASLGQLSAGVAHELNNPIGGILGYTQLIMSKLNKKDLAREDIDNSLKYLEMMEKESKRCQWIISNLLNFARKPLEERTAISIEDVINNTVSMVEYQAQRSNVKISASFPEGGLKKVNGNANELQQVFTNLIQNSRDAMPQGGQINITGKNMLDHRFNPPLEYIELRFSDTGVGISKENLPHIFEPFFTSKLGKAGTGLGLSISYTIVSSHKGL